MRHFVPWLPILIALLLFGSLSAQTLPPDWERFLETESDFSESSQLLEQLQEWLERPLDLNRATLEEMLLIPGFPVAGAYRLVWRRRARSFRTLEEVRSFLQVDGRLWNWISHFVTVRPPSRRVRGFRFGARVRAGKILEKSRGFAAGAFSGSPIKLYQRFRAANGRRFSAVWLAEKDPGERSWRDHAVGGMVWRLPFWNARLVMGDYAANIGRGLMLAPPYAAGGFADPFSVLRPPGLPFRPYASTCEAGYQRGAALHARTGLWELAVWFSSRREDATLTASGQVRGFYTSGLHRTQRERAKMGRARVKMAGAYLNRLLPQNVQLRIAALRVRFSPPLAKRAPDRPPNWLLQGGRSTYWEASLRGVLLRFYCFAEAVWQNAKPGALQAGLLRRKKDFQWLLFYRNYRPFYDSPFAVGLSGGSAARNEQGWKTAWRWTPSSGTEWILAADLMRTPWRTYSLPLPQSRTQMYAQFRTRIAPGYSLFLRYTCSWKQEQTNLSAPSAAFRSGRFPVQVEKFRLHQDIHLRPGIKLAARFEMSRCRWSEIQRERPVTRGWLLYWEIGGRIARSLQLTARMTFFETQDYRTRLYQFEPSVPGILTSTLLYGRGVRFFAVFRFQPGRRLKLSGKYSSFRYENRTAIGSGWDEILSPVKHEILLQLDVNL